MVAGQVDDVTLLVGGQRSRENVFVGGSGPFLMRLCGGTETALVARRLADYLDHDVRQPLPRPVGCYGGSSYMPCERQARAVAQRQANLAGLAAEDACRKCLVNVEGLDEES